MTDQTLGRRNTAPVQGTELELDSGMLDRQRPRTDVLYTSRRRSARGYWIFSGPRIERDAGLEKGVGRPDIDGPTHPFASREIRLLQDLGHRRLSGPPPGRCPVSWRNHVRRGCPSTARRPGIFPGISGPETAFVVQHDRPNARAAQRRPGAEHRARPGLLNARPS